MTNVMDCPTKVIVFFPRLRLENKNWIQDPDTQWTRIYQVSQQVLDVDLAKKKNSQNHKRRKIRESLFTFCLAEQISLQFDEFFDKKNHNRILRIWDFLFKKLSIRMDDVYQWSFFLLHAKENGWVVVSDQEEYDQTILDPENYVNHGRQVADGFRWEFDTKHAK